MILFSALNWLIVYIIWRSDTLLQEMVYKLVPGLYRRKFMRNMGWII